MSGDDVVLHVDGEQKKQGRTLWGVITNRSRDLARQIIQYVQDSEPKKLSRICGFVVVYISVCVYVYVRVCVCMRFRCGIYMYIETCFSRASCSKTL